jgi:hypothetical protein
MIEETREPGIPAGNKEASEGSRRAKERVEFIFFRGTVAIGLGALP